MTATSATAELLFEQARVTH